MCIHYISFYIIVYHFSTPALKNIRRCMCQVDIGKIISGIQTTNTASLDRKPSEQFACAATADGNINSLPQSSHGPLYCKREN